MERHNNWMSFSFGDVEYGIKQHRHDVLQINFNKPISTPLPSYKEALLNNARIMRDSYSDPFDVCLSGGTDSEVVVRTFKSAGIKHNTFIFKLENDYNVRDVTNAVNLCNELNIDYKIIDFNLKKFFEDEALAVFEKTKTPMAGRLPRLKFIDYLDNIPIFCDGEPYWRRALESDYNKKSPWLFQLHEDGYAVSIYSKMIGRTVIGDWYEYTPEVIMSYKELPLVRQLLNDELTGKISTNSSRATIHQDIWPTLQYKAKLVGYEGADLPVAHRPNFMNDFYKTYMSDIIDVTLKYTEEELNRLLLSV
jgi:hypothetical protein